MPLEIERKFLVASDSWKNSVARSVRIRDGLIASNNGQKARVRISDDAATIALKSRRRGLVRTEFEYEIPYSDAEEIMRTMCEGETASVARRTQHGRDRTPHQKISAAQCEVLHTSKVADGIII
jgi:adenylate cyclase